VSKVNIVVDIFNLEGKRISSIPEQTILPGKVTLSKKVDALPPGLYTVRVTSHDSQAGEQSIQTAKFIK